MLIFAGCADGPDRDIEHRLFVSHPALDMVERDETQIIASPTEHTFTWTSADPTVASVSSTGLVKAIKDGVSIITVVSSGGLRREIPVNVTPYVELTGFDVAFINERGLTQIITTDLNIPFGRDLQLFCLPIPRNYNERIPFEFSWNSSDESIVRVSDRGILTPMNFGEAEITVSFPGRTSIVDKVFTIEILENPITKIEAPATMQIGLHQASVSVITELLPLNYNVKDASLKWESLDPSKVEIIHETNGGLRPIGTGTTTVRVSLNADPDVFTDIEISVFTMNFNAFTAAGTAGPTCVREPINLVKDQEITIAHLTQQQIARAYNRDFMSYNPDTEKLVFTGPTGTYDIFYTAAHSYIFVCIWTGAAGQAPNFYWILGNEFSATPDITIPSANWTTNNIQGLGFMNNLGDGKYQASLNMKRSGSVVQVRTTRGWTQHQIVTLIGPDAGNFEHDFATGGDQIFCRREPGYYRFIFDLPAMTLHIERIADPYAFN